ncbi:MAG: glucans biosynthesis glucosyltransferase MdoH [Alphaproteobacteria bacterium]|nr:MAG: glucans biosynthesis glucosyltransferase MdoH [Alphaproteobacteria bacterium]
MDALRLAPAAPPCAACPYLPPEAPLAMPVQSLRDGARAPVRFAAPAVAARRAFVLGTALLLSAIAAYQMYFVLAVGGLTTLEAAILVLFVVLFAWVAFSFASTLGGVIAMATRRTGAVEINPDAPLPAIESRTALLLPTYNEEPDRVFSRVQAVYESAAATGQEACFDVYILSDTTNPDIFVAEEAAFLALREHLGAPARVYYRHRPKNDAKKAGNIAEWLQRFGGHYAHMIVLDADSLMTGDTLVRLVAAMERHPGVGLIQTFPVMVNATTTFARVQQFAGRLYGPLIAYGLAWWHGADGNYWGHNAIIRVRAFAECAGLPALSGPRPIGGHILSHDFVEAALIRRGGWAVVMAPALGGSYEESPPSLTEYAARDRRWCQGNLQHMGVLPARGLHWVTRLHLATGIGAYVAAPLWLLFLFVGILISLQAQFIRPEYFPKTFTLYPQWPAQDPVRAAYVFAGTMALLLLPKLIGYLAMLADRARRKAFGGAIRAFFSMLAETLISGLIAPIMMLIQSASVLAILSGRDSGWQAQRRDDGTLPLRAVMRRYGWHTAFGLLLALAAYEVSYSLFAWMTPVIAGLILAVPLVQWTANPQTGLKLRRMKLLLTPEESQPPEVLERANALIAEFAGSDRRPAVERLFSDPALLAAHRAMLPQMAARQPGEIDVARVVAFAKLEDCISLQQAIQLLTRAEMMALLMDAHGLDRLAALDRAVPALKNVK